MDQAQGMTWQRGRVRGRATIQGVEAGLGAAK